MNGNDISKQIQDLANEIHVKLIAIRRDIHAHPELAFEEFQTAKTISDTLNRLDIQHKTGIGKTGIMARIDTGRPGKHLLIRADMDALPIEEQTGLSYASTVKGKMHACGHDLHVTMLLGVAEILSRLQDKLVGTVSFMFQPAEETSESGAAAMIRENILDDVDRALGFHNYPDMAVGLFGYTKGIPNGSSDEFSIVVKGISGHAARPHLARDPLTAAATLLLQLQTIVSREVDPMHPAVLTIGSMVGGITENIIPDQCILKGTVRCQHQADRELIDAAIARHCKGIETSMNVSCEYKMVRGVPSIINDDEVTRIALGAIEHLYGTSHIIERPANLGSEDFALISERVPAFQLGIGSATQGRHDALHNSDYQPDERCLLHGVIGLSLSALALLQ